MTAGRSFPGPRPAGGRPAGGGTGVAWRSGRRLRVDHGAPG